MAWCGLKHAAHRKVGGSLGHGRARLGQVRCRQARTGKVGATDSAHSREWAGISGSARLSLVWCGLAVRGVASFGLATDSAHRKVGCDLRTGGARIGKSGRGSAGHGKCGLSNRAATPWVGRAWSGMVRQGKSWRDGTVQGRVRHG